MSLINSAWYWMSEQFAQILMKYYHSEYPISFWYRGVRIKFSGKRISVWGIVVGSLDQAIDSIDLTINWLAEHPDFPRPW